MPFVCDGKSIKTEPMESPHIPRIRVYVFVPRNSRFSLFLNLTVIMSTELKRNKGSEAGEKRREYD